MWVRPAQSQLDVIGAGVWQTTPVARNSRDWKSEDVRGDSVLPGHAPGFPPLFRVAQHDEHCA